jgi:hypothetical protein
VLIILFICAAAFLIPATALGITLSWQRPDAPDITGYHIYYGPSGTNYRSAPRVIIDSPDQTQCQITDLEPGTTYEFTATSVDSINNRESDFSPIISYTVPEFCSICAEVEGEGGVMIDSNVGVHENVTYSYGETVEMTAVPDKGYTFICWKENGEVVSRQKQYTFTAESDRTLTAIFRKVNLTAVMMLLLD